jgi:hypothetical protein
MAVLFAAAHESADIAEIFDAANGSAQVHAIHAAK